MAQANNEDPLEEVLGAILEKLSALPGHLGYIGKVLEQFHKAITPLISSIANIFSPSNSGTGGGGGPGGGSGGGAAVGIAGLTKVGLIAAAALGALVVSINLAQNAFQQMIGYVRLFNPGVIAMFQFALDNLGATIGRAFTPAVQLMTSVVREFTAILAPVMARLVPVVQSVAQAFSGILLQYIQNVGNALQGMIPVIKIVAEILGAVGQILVLFQTQAIAVARVFALVARVVFEIGGLGAAIRIVTRAFEALNSIMGIVEAALDIFDVVLTTVVDSLGTFMSSLFPIGKIMENLGNAVQFVIRNMFVMAIAMARFIGLTSIMDGLMDFVAKKMMKGDVAAQQPQIKNLEQISKDLAIAAATAGGAAAGGGGVQSEAEFWKKTLDDMKDVKKNGLSIRDLIERILVAIERGLNPLNSAPPAPPPPGGGVSGGGIPPPAESGGGGHVSNTGNRLGEIAYAIPGPIIGNIMRFGDIFGRRKG